MQFIFLLLILCLVVMIISLLVNYNKTKKNFQKKISLLEDLVNEISTNLITQNQKVKLSDDIIQKIKESNYTLSKSIFDVNVELFEELYPRKKQ